MSFICTHLGVAAVAVVWTFHRTSKHTKLGSKDTKNNTTHYVVARVHLGQFGPLFSLGEFGPNIKLDHICQKKIIARSEMTNDFGPCVCVWRGRGVTS